MTVVYIMHDLGVVASVADWVERNVCRAKSMAP